MESGAVAAQQTECELVILDRVHKVVTQDIRTEGHILGQAVSLILAPRFQELLPDDILVNPADQLGRALDNRLGRLRIVGSSSRAHTGSTGGA